MANLSDLPPELVLKILSYLPIQSLHTIALLSRLWHQFLLIHEEPVYRHAAFYHRFVSAMDISLSDAKGLYSLRAIVAVGDWRSFCQCLCRLHSTWAGHGGVTSRVYSSPGKKVHRIKVDERVGIVITSHATGGIMVSDLQTDKLLWSLGDDYVRSWAHVEYGNGFLIFDRFGEYKEVWRLTTDCNGLTPSTSYPPDNQQIRRFTVAESHSTNDDKRGHFKPWALLISPEWGRAFRFVYPTLLVGSFSKAYLFNVESSSLVQVVDNTQQMIDGHPLGDIHYVEVSEQHVFLCGSVELRILNRADGRLVFRMDPNNIPTMSQMMVSVPYFSSRGRHAETQPILLQHDTQGSIGHHYFIAVHVCGCDLVVLRDDAQVIFIRAYLDAIQNRRSLSELAVNIKIKDSLSLAISHLRAVYMSFERGRVAVVTTAGVFIFTTDSTYHHPDRHISLSSQTNSSISSTLWGQPLSILCCRILSLEQPGVLGQVTCLQMTESKLFLAYHPSYAPEDRRVSESKSDSSPVAGPSNGSPQHLTTDTEGDDEDDDEWTDDDIEDNWEPELRSVVCIDFSP